VKDLFPFGGFADDAEFIMVALERLAYVGFKRMTYFMFRSVSQVSFSRKYPTTVFTDRRERIIETDNAKIPLWHGSSLLELGTET
jgi:hypothetical protein